LYADGLAEHAPPARAEFIRVQIEIARKEHLPRAVLNRYVPLFQRNQELIDSHRAELLGSLAALSPEVSVEFRRGFVSEVTTDLYRLCVWYDAIAVAVPLPRIVLADEAREVRAALGFVVDLAHHNGCPDVVAQIRTVWSRHEVEIAGNHLEELDPRVWPRLDELDISGCRLGDLYTTDLFRRSSFPVLSNLDLSGNDLTDAAVDSLLDSALPRQLKRLILGGNDITDAGALALAAQWPTGTNDRLENLNLRFAHIGQAGQRALLERFGGRVDLF
jgi:hypothetical protein